MDYLLEVYFDDSHHYLLMKSQQIIVQFIKNFPINIELLVKYLSKLVNNINNKDS